MLALYMLLKNRFSKLSNLGKIQLKNSKNKSRKTGTGKVILENWFNVEISLQVNDGCKLEIDEDN